MAANKNKNREVQFTFNDEDYKEFGRYRIMYTPQGRAMIRRQRLTYLIMAVMIAGLFTLFDVDPKFRYLMYGIAGVLAVIGVGFAETLVLRQQERAIESTANSAERVYAAKNTIRFDEDKFVTEAGDDVQEFAYTDIKLIDLTEHAIYVWMSDTMIMPVPLRAFKDMAEMKETCKWLREKAGIKKEDGKKDKKKNKEK